MSIERSPWLAPRSALRLDLSSISAGYALPGKERDYVTFFGLPAFMIFGTLWMWLPTFAFAVESNSAWVLGLVAIVLVPIMLFPVFMMWAAVYTQLN